MKIMIEGYLAGPPWNQFLVSTTLCPFDIWVVPRKVGSFVCCRCEYFKGKVDGKYVYCRRGDKKFRDGT